jgi:Family of unknown function (DUF6166)
MKTYRGWRRADGTAFVRIATNGELWRLSLRLDLCSHSPSGFEWGHTGSGPAQLALAILADALRHDPSAIGLHQPFKFEVIAALPREEPWHMTTDEVLQKAAAISELPLHRMEDGTIHRACPDCTGYLRDHGMITVDALGIHEYAPGVTVEDARRAVGGRHHGGRT